MLRLLRRLPVATTAAIAWWAYRNRTELARWARFAGTLPARLRDGTGDVGLEARVRAALTADPSTRGTRDVAVASVRAGVVVLHAPSSAAAAVHSAREVAARVPGVVDVRVEDPAPSVIDADSRVVSVGGAVG